MSAEVTVFEFVLFLGLVLLQIPWILYRARGLASLFLALQPVLTRCWNQAVIVVKRGKPGWKVELNR